MAFLHNNDGVLFFFNKCGTTMLRQTMPKGYAWHEHNSAYPSAGRTSEKEYRKRFKPSQPMYILVRDPIERFISGYWHYWRHYQHNFTETKDFVNIRYKKLVTEYTFDVHMDLVKQYDNTKLVDIKRPVPHHDHAFFQHCVHDIGDEYVDTMEIVRLGTTSSNQFLKPLLSTTKVNAKNDSENVYDYPDLKIADIHLEYILNKFRKTKERFGY
jgi:hypothetical protein